jgi:hypothetical protein
MTNVKVLVFALAVLAIVGASFAGAQTPYVGVFSDRAAWDPPPPGPPIIGDGTAETWIPPGVGVVDSLYLIAYNFNCLVTGIEWQILFPPEMAWIADIDVQPVKFGDSPVGAAMGWALPQDGFKGINVATVIFQWLVGSCGAPNSPVVVVGHPLFDPQPRYTCFGTPIISGAVGLTGLICPTVPVEETTWGKVKSLYVR